MKISESDLLITDEGRVYHLNLLPTDVAERIIVVGDPARVDMIAKYLDNIECDITHREFHTITGMYKEKRITIMSSGISSDNIDILMTELDALFNIDLGKREVKNTITPLEIVRIGTCGALQENIELGDFVISRYGMGLDGVLNYYENSESVRNSKIEDAFIQQTNWDKTVSRPYVVTSDEELTNRFKDISVDGFTVCGGGFFAPQGRIVRLRPAMEGMVDRITNFDYNGLKITNFEMEGAALSGMAALMGHKTTTICLAIAHRCKKASTVDYGNRMEELIISVLNRL